MYLLSTSAKLKSLVDLMGLERRAFWTQLSSTPSHLLRRITASTIPTQAAACLHHLAKNHPFLDANKRTAFATTIAFLGMNGYEVKMTEEEAYTRVMQVAQGEIAKEELSDLLEQHISLE
jgi:death-on-curing protein